MRCPVLPRSVAVLQALLIGATPYSLAAQHEPPLAPGVRVRVAHADPCCRTPQIGELVAVSSDSVVLRTGRAGTLRALPRAAVWSVERSRPAGSYILHGAIFGLLLGGGGGAAIGLATAGCESTDDCWAAFRGIAFGGAGALVGVITGAIIGAQVRREGWRRVELPVAVGLGPGRQGALAVGLALRFGSERQ